MADPKDVGQLKFRVVEVVAKMLPTPLNLEWAVEIIAALRALPVEERMEAMGMEPVGLAHQTCPIECVHYGEVERD